MEALCTHFRDLPEFGLDYDSAVVLLEGETKPRLVKVAEGSKDALSKIAATKEGVKVKVEDAEDGIATITVL